MSLKSRLWNARTLVTRTQLLAPVGRTVLRCVSWLHRQNPLQTRSTRIKNALYLNAGCGRNPQTGFVNLDYIWQPGVNLVWDLNWRLPFADNSLRGIYTEHCMEHLPFTVVTGHVLREFYRVLVPGHRLRLIVPDGGLYLRLYAEAQTNPDVSFPSAKEPFVTPMMHVNGCFRDHGHLYAYDFATLRHFLRKVGFSRVEHQSFQSGGDPILLLDSPERESESLYIEAVK